MKRVLRLLLSFAVPVSIILFLNFKPIAEQISIVFLLLILLLSKKKDLVLIALTFSIGFLYESFGISLHNLFNFGWYYPPLNYPPLWLLIGWIYYAWSANVFSENYEKFFIKNRKWFYAVLGIFFITSTVIYPEGNLLFNMLPIIGLVILYWKKIYTPRLEFFGVIVSFFDVIAEHFAISNGIWVYDYSVSIPSHAFLYLVLFPLIIVMNDLILKKIKL